MIDTHNTTGARQSISESREKRAKLPFLQKPIPGVGARGVRHHRGGRSAIMKCAAAAAYASNRGCSSMRLTAEQHGHMPRCDESNLEIVPPLAGRWQRQKNQIIACSSTSMRAPSSSRSPLTDRTRTSKAYVSQLRHRAQRLSALLRFLQRRRCGSHIAVAKISFASAVSRSAGKRQSNQNPTT